MGKTVSVLLIGLVMFIMAVVGGNQQMAISDHDITASGLAIESLPQNNSFQTVSFSRDVSTTSNLRYASLVCDGSPAINPSPHLPLSDKFITSFLLGYGQQPYLISLNDSRDQGLTFNRVSSDTKLGTAISSKISRLNRQSGLSRPVSFSNDLIESSPPGYFLLV